jgi:hypothetical protein
MVRRFLGEPTRRHFSTKRTLLEYDLLVCRRGEEGKTAGLEHALELRERREGGQADLEPGGARPNDIDRSPTNRVLNALLSATAALGQGRR